jgi:hypothetical protein
MVLNQGGEDQRTAGCWPQRPVTVGAAVAARASCGGRGQILACSGTSLGWRRRRRMMTGFNVHARIMVG